MKVGGAPTSNIQVSEKEDSVCKDEQDYPVLLVLEGEFERNPDFYAFETRIRQVILDIIDPYVRHSL